MAVTASIIMTLGLIGWSLWVRRFTWGSRWEVASTVNIALHGVAIFLLSPFATATVGQWLYELTGKRRLENYLCGHVYIVAAAVIIYSVLSRFGDDHTLQVRFREVVEYPLTIGVPLLLACYLMLPYKIYQLGVCLLLVWFSAYSITILRVLRRRDHRSRRAATLYLGACVSCITACLMRVAIILLPLPDEAYREQTWMLMCLCGSGYAIAAGHTWQRRRRSDPDSARVS